MIPTKMQTLVMPNHPKDYILWDGKFGLVNLDYDQAWIEGQWHVSRPTRNGAPRKTLGLPATARFTIDTLVTLTPDLQFWIHEMCTQQAKMNPTSKEAKNFWASLMSNDRFITNKTGSDTHADYVNENNLDAGAMKLQPMACGGAILKIIGETRIAGDDCWLFDAIDSLGNYRQYHPTTHPHLFFRPTSSARVEITNPNGSWTGKYIENKSYPFSQYLEKSIVPIFGVGNSYNALPKWRVRVLEMMTCSLPRL